MKKKYWAIALFILFVGLDASAEVQVPLLRLRFGYYFTKVTAGTVLKDAPLDSLFTFQPTALWDLPTFRSRVGVHFIGEFASTYGAFPISGIGFSGYFYPMGISSAYDQSSDNVVIQKYRTSPYVFGGVTPVNLNINEQKPATSTTPVSFSATMLEIMLGAGVDYPFRANLLLFGDVNYRFANAIDDEASKQAIQYFSIGVTLGIATSYF